MLHVGLKIFRLLPTFKRRRSFYNSSYLGYASLGNMAAVYQIELHAPFYPSIIAVLGLAALVSWGFTGAGRRTTLKVQICSASHFLLTSSVAGPGA